MAKKGDTLVEVCIAIGIFSLIAIGVASVMSSGTASSQTALETTLTREEIDSQADALRFVHEAYMNAKNSSADLQNDPYYKIWKKITDNALTSSNSATQYSPDNCKTIYDPNSDEGVFKQKAFILNVRNLSNPDNALISANNATTASVFQPAATYPHLIFGNATNNSDAEALTNTNSSLTNLYRAEGLYVIAVKDSGTDMIIDGSTPTSTSAFYDFYIRSCWYGTDAERPTAISTVIRLYDPPASKAAPPENDKFVQISFANVNSAAPSLSYSDMRITAREGSDFLANPKSDTRYSRKAKYRFLGWKVNTNPENTNCSYPELQSYYQSGGTFTVPGNLAGTCHVTLDADWNTSPFIISFNAGEGEFMDGSTVKTESCSAFNESCEYNYTIPNKYVSVSSDQTPTRSGYQFIGWNTQPNATSAQYTAQNSTIGQLTGNTTLYAVWTVQNEIINIEAKWTSYTDYDSYMELSKPGSNYYESAGWWTDDIYASYGDQSIRLAHGVGDGRGLVNNIYSEKFEINTLGGKNYYYSIRRFSGYANSNGGGYTSGGNVGNDITVTVKGTYFGTKTFYSRDKPNSSDCNYWNVFGYKNGRIVTRNTCSSSMEYGY